MEFDELFLTGFAMRLAAAGIGLRWDPSGIYTPGQVGIVVDAVPESPDDVVTLSAYAVSDEYSLADTVMGLQVRVRRAGQNPRPCRATGSKIFTNLQGLAQTALPAPVGEPAGVFVNACERRSHTPGGQDKSQRWSQIQNFYVTVHRPTTYRI